MTAHRNHRGQFRWKLEWFTPESLAAQRAFDQPAFELRLEIGFRAEPALEAMVLRAAQVEHFHGIPLRRTRLWKADTKIREARK